MIIKEIKIFFHRLFLPKHRKLNLKIVGCRTVEEYRQEQLFSRIPFTDSMLSELLEFPVKLAQNTIVCRNKKEAKKCYSFMQKNKVRLPMDILTEFRTIKITTTYIRW